MSLSRSSRLEWLWSFGPVAIWIAVIFYLSSGQGSSESTSGFIKPIIQWIFPAASVDAITAYHKAVRKCAHVVVYAVLGLLATRAIASVLSGSRRLLLAAAAMVVVLIVASLDEWNQSFNPARSSASSDVLFDALGGMIGTATFLRLMYRQEINRDSLV